MRCSNSGAAEIERAEGVWEKMEEAVDIGFGEETVGLGVAT